MLRAAQTASIIHGLSLSLTDGYANGFPPLQDITADIVRLLCDSGSRGPQPIRITDGGAETMPTRSHAGVQIEEMDI